MTCTVCRGIGYAWGGFLHRPELRRCACSGGPAELWEPWRPREEPAEEVPMLTLSLARMRREAALRGGSGR